MKTTTQETHRPGVFKRINKIHKTGRHRSKGAVNLELKGKSNVKTVSKHIAKELRKEARKNQLAQIRKRKREEVLEQKRNLGGYSAAPVLVCVIPLLEDLNVEQVISNLANVDETAITSTSSRGVKHISIPRFKQRFSLIAPPVGNIFSTLDAAKVASTILFVTSAHQTDGHIDDWGEEIMTACLAQGLPTTLVAITDLTSIHIKKRQDCKQHVQQIISKWLPEEKVYQLDEASDALNILRRAGSQKQRNVSYKNRRAHLLAEEFKFQENEGSADLGTLIVSGYLRGAPLSANDLIHIPGLGDFQMSQILAPEDPYSMDKNNKKIESLEQVRVLERANPDKQESLQSENIPDPMDAEQTWPTQEELAEAAACQKKKIVKVVPKGTSEYQAAWIPDEDANSVDQYSGDESEDGMSLDEAQSEINSEQDVAEDEEYDTITVSEAAPNEQQYDQDMDLLEERQAMEKLKEAKADAQFPDEVDTPQNILAKDRFQKYRGLESYRTSPWDPKENLPPDYARIFQFANFDHSRRRIFKECQEKEGASPGWYISLYIMNVQKNLFESFLMMDNQPLIVFGLLPNEHKMSVMNLILRHSNTYNLSIKSKERLIFQCGYRRFSSCPVFSQHTNGSKHKYERYFHEGATVVASMYAPIIFPPCPVLCYIEKKSGSLELVATGSILSADPDRLVIKRVILSGHPFKIHKKSAVIRFMFFNRQDINWFKPIELRTKHGRRGHIKEPLGTHGHMKCVFNGQLKSQDTVLMNLYKRVYPKWTCEPYLLNCTAVSSENQDSMNID